ncbi:hypothetical protein GB937_006105 [Aspergillus fischeri]|nr:hypothetical protein GB937_006105 [Aspergillus fischeri]
MDGVRQVGWLKMPDAMIIPDASQQPFLSKPSSHAHTTRTVGKSSESERPLWEKPEWDAKDLGSKQ